MPGVTKGQPPHGTQAPMGCWQTDGWMHQYGSIPLFSHLQVTLNNKVQFYQKEIIIIKCNKNDGSTVANSWWKVEEGDLKSTEGSSHPQLYPNQR